MKRLWHLVTVRCGLPQQRVAKDTKRRNPARLAERLRVDAPLWLQKYGLALTGSLGVVMNTS
jgi:hypothetical protein